MMSIRTLMGVTERTLARIRELYAEMESVPPGCREDQRRTDITWETKRNLDLLLLFKQKPRAPTNIDLELCDIINDIEKMARSIIGKGRSAVDIQGRKLLNMDMLHPALLKHLDNDGSSSKDPPGPEFGCPAPSTVPLCSENMRHL
jgi:hypothetical protein